MIVSPRPWGGSSWLDECVAHRVEWLSGQGGGVLVTPAGSVGPCLTTGIRHHEVGGGAAPVSSERVQQALVDMVRNLVSGRERWVVHAFGVEMAMGSLLARRGKARLVVEPDVSIIQEFKDRHDAQRGIEAKGASARGTHDGLPVQLEELARLEERLLLGADLVIARSTVEGAKLVGRGVKSDKVLTVPYGVLGRPRPNMMSAFPRIACLHGGFDGRDIAFFLSSLQYLDGPWRALMVGTKADRRSTFLDPQLNHRIEWIEPGEDVAVRLGGCQAIVCAAPPGRILNGGSYLPEAVRWGCALGLPIVAPDVPAVRSLSGGAPQYYPAGDAEECGRSIGLLLKSQDLRAQLADASDAQCRSLDWEGARTAITEAWHTLRIKD